ncbi:hypothetical protein LT493_10045 [Streptomyces tricolor]|nr:hypothetical protein [Streptomyces tricolor]
MALRYAAFPRFAVRLLLVNQPGVNTGLLPVIPYASPHHLGENLGLARRRRRCRARRA